MTERERIERAILALESQRAALGDAVVDTALASLRERLAALRRRPKPEEQRKHVSVLFADVSGFTATTGTMDAEDVSDMMNALWRRLDVVVAAHGGVIDKHIGDALMALWGVAEAREDDPELAIRAALALQTEFTDFSQQRGLGLAMRIGVNTGPVLLGTSGTVGEFTAVGDTVNLASRLERAAPEGGVLISHDTYRFVRGVFDVTPQAPFAVKGKHDPMRTYVVQRAKPRAFRQTMRGVEGVETRTIGREAELAVLQGAFHSTMRGDGAQAVVVVGEAGVGKSRLLYDFENWVELLPEEVRLFRGRSAAETMNLPYGLLRDLFRTRFEIFDDDSTETVREKFEAGMRGYLEVDQAHLVGQLAGFDFFMTASVRNLAGSDSFGKLALAYLTNYFRGVTEEDGAVVFLEDTHWADNASLDLVAHLVSELSGQRLLLVCLTRPILFERRPTWGEGPRFTRLTLNPLSIEDTRALVDEILRKAEAVPDDLRELVAGRAEGNPFYVEELIKMLIDDEVIVPGEERWRVEMERLKGVRVPPTLFGVLQARLDGLPSNERELLKRASVVGRLFWDAAVAALRAEGDEALDVPSDLEAVRARELVFRHERSAFAGVMEYLFKHAVLRDVTYETVLLKLRRVYHRQVAEWLEARGGQRVGEFAARIAEHYERARQGQKAVAWLGRAGETAHKTGAYREALAIFERALALVSDEDEAGCAALLVGAGNACERLSDFSAARAHLEAALELARKAGDDGEAANALNGLNMVAYRQSLYDEAQGFAEEALALAREAGERGAEARALRGLGVVAVDQGDNATAMRRYEESLEISRAVGDQGAIAACLSNMGVVAVYQDDYDAARRYFGEGLTIDRSIGDRWGIASCLINLGVVAEYQDDYAAAADHYGEGLTISREIGNRWGVAVCLNNLGNAFTKLGDDDMAQRHFHDSLAEAMRLGAPMVALYALTGIAGLQAKAGAHLRAAELLGLALGHPASISDITQTSEPTMNLLKEALPTEVLEAALARGKALDLEEVIGEILAEPG